MTERASTAVARLQRALAAASAGVWEWDGGRGEVTLSEELRTLLGFDPFDGPEDGELVRGALGRRDRVRLAQALDDAVSGDGAIGLDVLATCADEERMWLRVAGDVTEASDDEPARASGVAYDVTERKRLELRHTLGEAVSRVLVRATSIDEAAPGILEAIATSTEMEIAGLWLPADDGTLRCAQTYATEAARRSHPRFLAKTLATRLRPGEGLVGHAWNARTPLWIGPVTGQHGLVGPRAQFIHGLRSGVAIPLEGGDHLLGIIDLFSHRTRRRDDQLLEALAGLGNEFGLFILRQAAEASVRASDARQRLLVSVMQAQRDSDDPDDMLHTAAQVLGTHVAASRVDFVEVTAEGLDLRSSWSADAGATLTDAQLGDLVASGLSERLQRGEVTLFGPTDDGGSGTGDPDTATGIAVPVMRAGRWRAALLVHDDRARYWTAVEIGLTTDIAEHSWDAVERARARAALQASEARFRGTFENAAVGVAHVAPDGRWLRVNHRLCDITGYSEPELLQRTFADVTHPDDLDDDRAQLDRMLAGEVDTYQREKRYIRADGSPVWVDLTVSVVRSATGEAEYFISVVEDITARKAAEARLRTALAVKDEFLGLVSHELRTPMTVILGMSELLAGGRLDTQAVQAVAADIAASAADLNDLIESMLLLARLDSAAAETDEPMLVDRVAERAIARQRLRDPAREYALQSQGVVLAEAHPGLIERIVANLLSNASKYSHPGGRVDVMVEARDGEVLLHVLDEGSGVDDVDLQQLFEPFYRAPASPRAPGAGLGLSVVKRIAESFGGRVWAVSRGSGGSDFGFALPQLHVPDE